MKMRIGTRLLSAREERKLNQAEMSDLLGVSPSTYSRLERNETSVELEQVVQYSKILQIPIQEFLPDTLTVNNSSHENNQNAQGLVLGSIYNYNYSDKEALLKEMALKNKEIEFLKEKIMLLEGKISNLEQIIQLKSNS